MEAVSELTVLIMLVGYGHAQQETSTVHHTLHETTGLGGGEDRDKGLGNLAMVLGID